MRLMTLLLLLLCGCAQTRVPQTERELSGKYANVSRSRVLTLYASGTFDYVRRDDDMHVTPHGDVLFKGSGTTYDLWKRISSGHVELTKGIGMAMVSVSPYLVEQRIVAGTERVVLSLTPERRGALLISDPYLFPSFARPKDGVTGEKLRKEPDKALTP